MATTQTLPTHFLFRRLHSLSGLIPIGAFFLEHIYTSSYSLLGPDAYNARLAEFHSLPFWIVFEVVFILLPILFHALYGLVLIYQGKNTVARYGYGANWRYFLQRFTGLIALLFIGSHVYFTRIAPGMKHQFASYQSLQIAFQNPFVIGIYVLGVIAVAFHFCNGVWLFLITWGVTITPISQKTSLKICLLAFVFLSLIQILIVANLAFPMSPARSIVLDPALKVLTEGR